MLFGRSIQYRMSQQTQVQVSALNTEKIAKIDTAFLDTVLSKAALLKTRPLFDVVIFEMPLKD